MVRVFSRGIWRTTTVIAAGVLITGVVVASEGRVDTVGADPGDVRLRAAPAWATPCQQREPRHDRELLRSCARVRGRVLAVEHKVGEIHLMMIADFHLFVVKLPPQQPRPSLGSNISVVGPLVRARNGLREVDAAEVNRL